MGQKLILCYKKNANFETKLIGMLASADALFNISKNPNSSSEMWQQTNCELSRDDLYLLS